MGLNLMGCLGLGMGCMSASFQTGGKRATSHDALIKTSSAASPAGPACASMEYVSDVAVAGRDGQYLWRRQRRERPWCLGV